MKRFNLLLGVLFLTSICMAQRQGTINVNKGQKFQVKSDTKVITTTEAMGQQMEININASGTTVISVDDAADNDYDITGMLKALKMNMSMMGQEMAYDSENPDNSNPMSSQIGMVLNQPQKIKMDKTGKVVSISTEGDFNQLLRQFGSAGAIGKQAFLAIPANLGVGDTFSTNDDDESAGSKTTVNYTVKSIEGDLATLAFTGTVSTDMTTESQGMEVHVVTNGTTEGEVVVNRKTGVLKTAKNKVKSSGNSEVMGQQMPTEVEAETITTVTEG